MAMVRPAKQKEETAEGGKPDRIYRSCSVSDLGPCKKKLSLEVGPERIQAGIEEMLGEMVKTVAVPGFRAGKAPRAVIERKFAKEIEGDVRGDLIEKALHEALEEKGWEVLRHPHLEEKDLSFDPAKGLAFSVEVLIQPEFTIDGYAGLALKKPKPAASDKEVDAGLEDLRKQRAQWIPAEGAVAETDLVIGALTLSTEGQEPISREGFMLFLEEGTLGEIPVEKLGARFKGRKPGETVDLDVDVPVTFGLEGYRGRKAKASVRIDEAKRAKLPDLDEAFAKLFHVESVAALREEVGRTILGEKGRLADLEVENQIHEALLAKAPFELPEEVIVGEAARLLRRYQRSLQARGFSPESVREKLKEAQSRSMEEAARRLRIFFILERIALKEKIYASEQELDRYIAAMAASAEQRPERVRAELERDGSLDDIRSQIRHAKVIEHLKSKAQIAEA